MGSTVSKIAIVCALGFGFLLWPGTSPADDDRQERRRRGGSGFRATQGQEVVTGSYTCDGTVYTDDQETRVDAATWLNATSGITTGFYGTAQSSSDVPADLDAMAEICEAHVSLVLAQVPAICALGPIENGRFVFGNGTQVRSSFDFSCQGTRDEVIDVIGSFSRVALTARL